MAARGRLELSVYFSLADYENKQCRGKPDTPMKKPLIAFIFLLALIAALCNQSEPNRQALPTATRSIQSCLDTVKPGGECLIASGTYNESLTLRTSGTTVLPITLRCETVGACTVNSGTAKTLVTSGAIHYYIIDGFKFISLTNPTGPTDATINLSGTWAGYYDTNAGNNGFIIRNCYVEGEIRFYGHNNLVENCEFNGLNKFSDALSDGYGASHDNVYRNNTFYDYTGRGIWSLQVTDNILMEGNSFRNAGKCIDSDGAGIPVYRHTIRGNTFTNCSMAIELENAFETVVEGNRFENSSWGIHQKSYGNSSDFHTEGNIEYRNVLTNNIIRNNLFLNCQESLNIQASPGGLIEHNTIVYNVANSFPAIGFTSYDGWYSHSWTAKNNIIIRNNPSYSYILNSQTGLNNFVSDYNLFVVKAVFRERQSTIYYTRTPAQWQATGRDVHSLFTDPLFTSDYHLQPSSPACKGGQNGGYMGAYPCVVATGTPTLTATATQTLTPTLPPTATLTITPSSTATFTPTVTASQTPSATNTSTPTNTPTPTLTPTPTAFCEWALGDLVYICNRKP